jgi:hypothetical protein
VTSLAVICLVVASCSKPQPPSDTDQKPPITSIGVVEATPIGASLAKGESGEAAVRLKIDDGYHVNANPATLPYLIPTQLDITPATGISVDFITYPNGVIKKFSFSPDQALAVYEGQTDLKLRLTAAKTAQPGEHNLSVKLRVQACDDQVCYAPGTLDFTLPVTIK